jgi:hypothetical protein
VFPPSIPVSPCIRDDCVRQLQMVIGDQRLQRRPSLLPVAQVISFHVARHDIGLGTGLNSSGPSDGLVEGLVGGLVGEWGW